MEKEIEDHIRFKALTSYDYRRSSEKMVEYVAKQVALRQTLLRLKTTVKTVIDALSEEERLLMDLRYFGKLDDVVKRLRGCLRRSDEPCVRARKICQTLGIKRVWSERSYFRKQKALLEKVEAKFIAAGLSDKDFENDYGDLGVIRFVQRVLERGREVVAIGRELALVRKLKEVCKEDAA